jgi:YidC/Oxa1 family membrane protein insertase
MEKRALLAAVLMAVLLLLYQNLFMPSAPPEPPAPAEQPAQEPAAKSARETTPAVPRVVSPRPAPAVPERTVPVETPLFRAEISSSGGAFRAWELAYRGKKPLVVAGVQGPGGLRVERAGEAGRALALEPSVAGLKLRPGTSEGEIVLRGEDGFGLHVTERLRFRADSYVVEHEIRVENRHDVAQAVGLVLPWSTPLEWPKEEPEKFQGQRMHRVVMLGREGLKREEIGAEAAVPPRNGRWIGLESEWYLAALVPQGETFKATAVKRDDRMEIGLRAAVPELAPGQAWEGRFLAYVGPKEYARLQAAGVGLEQAVFFGGFPAPEAYGGLPMRWVVVPILWLMHRFYDYTGNYGVAIILLTFITKVLFFPLSLKSMKSMKAMQLVQPQVNALRAKIKNDPQRLQRETMELYRKHKVNPLGGCLPMVVQIPVFYALYVALSVSVEIQNAPFICLGRIFGYELWICDLAAHDPTYVLPILMGVSMFVQQKLTPVMGDPRQAKMMMFMPVLFTFMFLNLPSGLVLYWTVSNVLQIAQQLYMNRGARAEAVPARAPRKA